MTCKPVVPREQANQDVDSVIDYYLREANKTVALGFIDALERAYAQIGRHPTAGSPRYAHELNLPGLRACPVDLYPYLVFYIEGADHIDVWRALHSLRDIPAWLQEPDGT